MVALLKSSVPVFETFDIDGQDADLFEPRMNLPGESGSCSFGRHSFVKESREVRTTRR